MFVCGDFAELSRKRPSVSSATAIRNTARHACTQRISRQPQIRALDALRLKQRVYLRTQSVHHQGSESGSTSSASNCCVRFHSRPDHIAPTNISPHNLSFAHYTRHNHRIEIAEICFDTQLLAGLKDTRKHSPALPILRNASAWLFGSNCTSCAHKTGCCLFAPMPLVRCAQAAHLHMLLIGGEVLGQCVNHIELANIQTISIVR